MFKDFKEFKQFMIFCHTHYELNDVWYSQSGDKGLFFTGWHNDCQNLKYSPMSLENPPEPNKRNTLEEVYDCWLKVKENLQFTN